MKRHSEAYPAHVRAFSELLIKLRAELGSDLDQVLILAVVAERYYAAIETACEERVYEAESGGGGINAHSVALYTEIPRETVRRKIKVLVEKGWLDCDTRGNLTPTAQAAWDLKEGTDATWKYIRAITCQDQE